MIVGNLVGSAEVGFEAELNEVVLVTSTGETVSVPRAPKRDVAERIFDQILKLRLALHAAQ
jgi:phosphopantothenoylcysteine synthetase/decarboxylase